MNSAADAFGKMDSYFILLPSNMMDNAGKILKGDL